MKVSEWLTKANKLSDTCKYQINVKNGSKSITMPEATFVEMIAVVEAGQKTSPLTPR